MKLRHVAPALLGTVALTFAGCASAPGTGTSSASGSADGKFKACMVSDAGGFDDKSFNQTSYEGLVRAESELGVERAQVQSTNTADYTRNVQSMVDANCDIVVGVGFALADAIEAAGKANPDVKFALVDSAIADPLPNVKALLFNTNEPSFLAGYLAASLSKTGTVATYGGAAYPSVKIFMDGYALGVAYYNQQKGANVQLLGWDVAKQDGTFVQSADPFGDVNAGRTTAQNQISQGADILFPVAGNSGTGALQASQANGAVSTIWVDADGCVSAEQFCAVIPTSVYKAMDLAVFEVIKAAQAGTFDATSYIGDLENDGTSIAPYHDFESKISAETKSEIDTIKKGIIDGTIKVDSVNANH